MRPDSHLFWDTDVSALDVDRQQTYIIPRIMDYGSLEDVLWAMRYYPEATIRAALTQSPSLQRRTIVFFHHFYGIPLEQFNARCKPGDAFWEG